VSKDSLLVNRVKMAQGAISLLDKNLKEALILATEYDKLRSVSEAGDQDQDLVTEREYFDMFGES